MQTLASAAALAKLLYERLFHYILDRSVFTWLALSLATFICFSCNEKVNGGADHDGFFIGLLDMAGFEMMHVRSFSTLFPKRPFPVR